MKGSLIGGILLIAGCCIGAGMLALPISTGMAGFIPSVVLFFFYWLFMTYTAFLILEVNLWTRDGGNLMSMIRLTLGKPGEIIGWCLYLFLLYALTTAYIAGCAPIVIDIVQAATEAIIPEWIGAIPLFLIFAFFVYKGTRAVDRVNRLLMLGLVVAYALLVILLLPSVNPQLLHHIDLTFVPVGLSVIATSFGFHIIIPSLVTYFDRNVIQLKRAIFIGGLIPLFVYILWEYLALGIIPLEGQNGIMEGYIQGANGAHLLSAISTVLGHPAVALVARLFSFFAIVTSFLGVSLSLSDFLADGLGIKKTRQGRLLLLLLTFIPPLAIVLYDPRAFLTALEYAGAFGVITLLGLFPAMMVWSARYIKKIDTTSKFHVRGGKTALVIIMLASCFIIGTELWIKLT